MLILLKINKADTPANIPSYYAALSRRQFKYIAEAYIYDLKATQLYIIK